jgi:hypothetical protein
VTSWSAEEFFPFASIHGFRLDADGGSGLGRRRANCDSPCHLLTRQKGPNRPRGEFAIFKVDQEFLL